MILQDKYKLINNIKILLKSILKIYFVIIQLQEIFCYNNNYIFKKYKLIIYTTFGCLFK